MSRLPQRGFLIVHGQTIEVKYVLETTKRQYSRTENVLSHVRSPQLQAALPDGKVVSATLRLQGGMVISVVVTSRVGNSASIRALEKPTAWA